MKPPVEWHHKTKLPKRSFIFCLEALSTFHFRTLNRELTCIKLLYDFRFPEMPKKGKKILEELIVTKKPHFDGEYSITDEVDRILERKETPWIIDMLEVSKSMTFYSMIWTTIVLGILFQRHRYLRDTKSQYPFAETKYL